MKALGRGSVAAILRIVLEILRIILLVILAAIGLLALVAAYVYVRGEEAALPGVVIERLDPWWATGLGFLVTAGFLVVMILVVDRLRLIFRTLAQGDPFVPENAAHLRAIWVAIAAFEVARYVVGGVVHISVAAAGAPPAGVSTSLVTPSPPVWFAVLTLFVLAEVFREGARMRGEQSLTI